MNSQPKMTWNGLRFSECFRDTPHPVFVLLGGKTEQHPWYPLLPETLTSHGERDMWELVKFWNEKEIWGKHVTSFGLQVIVFLKTRVLFCFPFLLAALFGSFPSPTFPAKARWRVLEPRTRLPFS